MQCVKLLPSYLKGELKIPPSKSLAHRAIIAGGLTEGTSRIKNIVFSDDILATCRAMESLGVGMEKKEDGLLIHGRGRLNPVNGEIDCRESGSTLRFLIPIVAITGKRVTFTGRGKLISRPLHPYYAIFNHQGIAYQTTNGGLPLTLEGKLKSGDFYLRGDISSQFITGLLFALPLLEGDSRIIVTTELESKGYVDLTIDLLQRFSVEVEHHGYREFLIRGGQGYQHTDYEVEGDFSQAAFWLVAGVLNGEVGLTGLDPASLQGDRVIIDLIRKMGGAIIFQQGKVSAQASRTEGITIDASQCPDLVPILAVLGACSRGTTEITNAARLRLKESDRLKAIATELAKLGAAIEEKDDGLLISGRECLKGGIVDSWHDHRIAMALAVAALRCKEPVVITNSGAVSKSYPGFFQDFAQLGGKVNEWSMGQKA